MASTGEIRATHLPHPAATSGTYACAVAGGLMHYLLPRNRLDELLPYLPWLWAPPNPH
jgi:hypothetical protein